jgi:predicted aspartyl protease
MKGTFRYQFAVGSADGARFEGVEALVDTGATYTWIPRSVLDRLGAQLSFRRRLRMADGSIIERDAAVLPVRLDGQMLPTVVIFGDPGSDALLGAVTLEEFSLGVDPIEQRLVPVVALLM